MNTYFYPMAGPMTATPLSAGRCPTRQVRLFTAMGSGGAPRPRWSSTTTANRSPKWRPVVPSTKQCIYSSLPRFFWGRAAHHWIAAGLDAQYHARRLGARLETVADI